jgi:hypothetical protein
MVDFLHKLNPQQPVEALNRPLLIPAGPAAAKPVLFPIVHLHLIMKALNPEDFKAIVLA